MPPVDGQPGKPQRKDVRERPCPVCSKLSIERFRPFCSARCADVDLNRWLSGGYSVPVVELEPEDLAELAEIDAREDTDR